MAHVLQQSASNTYNLQHFIISPQQIAIFQNYRNESSISYKKLITEQYIFTFFCSLKMFLKTSKLFQNCK